MSMLTLLTKSKITQKIILLFVYNPGRRYYINEIARIVGTSAGNTHRALEKLEQGDFLTKEKKDNATYYQTNTANPLFNDFKKFIDKTIGIDKILKNELDKLPFIQFAFLFGSYVKGGFNANSDIDLYVIGNIDEKKLHGAIKTAEEQINREINYHFSSAPEFQQKRKDSFFHKEILQSFNLIIGDENEFRRAIQ